MSTEQDLEKKLQTATRTWLLNSGTHSITIGVASAQIRHFEEDDTDEQSFPTIVLRATRIREHPRTSGNWEMLCECKLKVQANDTAESDFGTYWSKMVAILMWDQLAARLSDTSEFTCLGVLMDEPSDKQVVDTHWEQTFAFRAHCAAL